MILCLVAGCSLFEIRDPSPPSGGFRPRQPNHPDSVIWNLETAIRFKVLGVNQIRETLDDDMVFVLDRTDAQSLGGVDSLNKAEVERGFDGFFEDRVEPDSIVADIKLEERERVEETENVTLYVNVPYELTAYRYNDYIAGVADISFLEQSDGNWTILRWADKASALADNTLGFFLGSNVANTP